MTKIKLNRKKRQTNGYMTWFADGCCGKVAMNDFFSSSSVRYCAFYNALRGWLGRSAISFFVMEHSLDLIYRNVKCRVCLSVY